MLQLHVPVPLRLFVSTSDSMCVPSYVIGSATFYYKYPVVAIVSTPALYSFTICESIPSHHLSKLAVKASSNPQTTDFSCTH